MPSPLTSLPSPVRQAESKPLVTELRVWFEAQLAKLPARGPLAEAIRYALNHWDGLARFLDDGRIELDNNSIERAMRILNHIAERICESA